MGQSTMEKYKNDKLGLDIATLLTGLAFMGIGAWLVFRGNRFGWLSLLFGALCVAHEAYALHVRRRLRLSRAERRALLRGDLFAPAPEDDVEIWRRLLGATESSWVLFENGSLVLCGASSEPEAFAAKVIEQYEQITPGSSSADFSVRLFAEAGVWVVCFATGNVLSLVRLEECEQETAAGMLAREALKEDATHRRIVHVHSPAKRS